MAHAQSFRTHAARPSLPVLIFAAALSTANLCFHPALAQVSQPAQAAVVPSDQELDALLAARDWNGLGAALSQPTGRDARARAMSWLRTRIDAGGGSFLSFLYARDLWLLGRALDVNDPKTDLRVTAAMITLYAYEVLQIDGARCEDDTAPARRIEQLLAARRETLAYIATKPADLRARVVEVALALERRTAPLRREDDLICRGGLEEMQAGLKRGTQREVRTPPGGFGRTVEVQPPANWNPTFVSPEIYRPLQDRARAGMKAALLKLVGL